MELFASTHKRKKERKKEIITARKTRFEPDLLVLVVVSRVCVGPRVCERERERDTT